MPEVEHSTIVGASRTEIWAFVRDISNWAPFLTGYQSHETLSENESIWFVKGELGGMTRIAEFQVHVTQWDEPGRVTFTMEGLEEPVTGSGEFLAEALDATLTDAAVNTPQVSREGPFHGLLARLSRWLLRRATTSEDVTRTHPPVATAGIRTRITFRLNLSAGGMSGPVLNMLLKPILAPIAEDLALKIANAVEKRGGQ